MMVFENMEVIHHQSFMNWLLRRAAHPSLDKGQRRPAVLDKLE
jgi:hypothetical protein